MRLNARYAMLLNYTSENGIIMESSSNVWHDFCYFIKKYVN